MKIDFIIPWVDGTDNSWNKEKQYWKLQQGGLENKLLDNDDREMRYMDWGLLCYWFRGVEKFAPWVNRVHFVTNGQIPEWLDQNNQKINIVNHKDFIPDQYLPTYSSHAIELNFHRIKELEEHFVYFNDDMFLTDHVLPEDFFKKSKPRDCAILNVKCFTSNETMGFSQLVDTAVINKNFNKNQVMKKFWLKWYHLVYGKEIVRNLLLLPWNQFPDFYVKHLPTNMLKSTYEKVWEKEYEILNTACIHKFRNYTDVNQWLFTFWQICEGNFYPQKIGIGKAYNVGENIEEDDKLYKDIMYKKYKMICIGESEKIQNFKVKKMHLKNAFDKILKEKSTFEKK